MGIPDLLVNLLSCHLFSRDNQSIVILTFCIKLYMGLLTCGLICVCPIHFEVI